MLDLVFEDCVSDFFSAFFVDKFCGVAPHENDGVFALELLLQKLEVWQHVQAVDAAVRPEVNKDDLATQVSLDREWLRVEPDVVLWELLRLHLILLTRR